MAFNLEALLQQSEGKTLEFKRKFSSPENILKTLVAFANTACGVLLIGVEDENRKPKTEQVTDQVTEQVKRLLECLSQGPLAVKEAIMCVQLKHRPTFTYDYLQPTVEAGLVEMTQPESPKSPTQKYRLTVLGKKTSKAKQNE